MNLQEEFAGRMYRAAKAFRNELIARGEDEQILPDDQIKSDIVPGGVKLKFWKQATKPKGKPPKVSDES